MHFMEVWRGYIKEFLSLMIKYHSVLSSALAMDKISKKYLLKMIFLPKFIVAKNICKFKQKGNKLN